MTAPQRNAIPPHKCFYTWDIHYACNYRCSYCFFHASWEEEKKKNRYPGIDRWKAVWDDLHARYGEGHLHVSGGEPFHYPGLVDLVTHLVDRFTVEFDTNLSFDVEEFMRRVPPGRVKFATAFHPQFADFEDYFRKVAALKKEGYDLGVNYVAFPEQLAGMERYRQRLNEARISFDVMPFRGNHRGKEYPQGYSESERKLICECDPRTAPRMLDAYGKSEEKPAPDGASAPPVSRNPHLGKRCRMGQMYAKIHADGTAYRCCLIKEQGVLGNLIDGTFRFRDEPEPCGYDKCPCWVAMIVDEEKNWLFHWATPKIKAPSELK